MRCNYEKGFTLLEIMVVVAIIAILSAIAIPNFISYRKRFYCISAESDAQIIANKIADYYSIASHNRLPMISDLNITPFTLSSGNSAGISGDMNGTISITVTDGHSQCPTDYQAGMNSSISPNGFWSGDASNAKFTKLIRP